MRRYHLNINKKDYTVDVQEITATQFYVLVNGQEFEVTLAASSDLPQAVITPQIVPVSGADLQKAYKPAALETLEPLPRAPLPALPPRPALTAEEMHAEVIAPMPGTILSVEVQPGDQVQRGQTLAILEAMKMKNTIKSPLEAVVSEVLVAAGQVIGYGDVLVRFEEA
jgi:biotin carboxyl carrier protein